MSAKCVSLSTALLRAALMSCVALGKSDLFALDSAKAPRPIPLTRPEMKQYLEDMKARSLRIPLPELTDADREKLGDRVDSYENRLRYHYLAHLEGTGFNGPGSGRRPTGGTGTGGQPIGRDNDPDMTLDYAFKTQLFWIVSRSNNCQYCLGHQESKLLAAGMTEDQIAALDGDWSEHTPAQRAAYVFARKFTYEPHLLGNDDIASLKPHYNDKQILEMILSMAGNNSINRWKEGAGIPQSHNGGNFGNRRPGEPAATAPAATTEAKHSYLTPTSPKFESLISKVAPVSIDSATGKPTRATLAIRPKLESREEAERKLLDAAKRSPRLPLIDEGQTRSVLAEASPTGTIPNWMRLLATFPNSAKARVTTIQTHDTKGDLSPLLKAQLSWIVARQDRAWYAAGDAKRRLKALGWSDDQVYQLDGDWSDFSDKERSLFTLARKLAAAPVVLTDADVAEALKQVGPRDVVQAVSYTTNRASFNRITEAAGLPVE